MNWASFPMMWQLRQKSQFPQNAFPLFRYRSFSSVAAKWERLRSSILRRTLPKLHSNLIAMKISIALSFVLFLCASICAKTIDVSGIERRTGGDPIWDDLKIADFSLTKESIDEGLKKWAAQCGFLYSIEDDRVNPPKISVSMTNATPREILNRLTKEDGYLVWTYGARRMVNLLPPKVYDDHNYDLNCQLKETPFGYITLLNYYDLLDKVRLPSGKSLVVNQIEHLPATYSPPFTLGKNECPQTIRNVLNMIAKIAQCSWRAEFSKDKCEITFFPLTIAVEKQEMKSKKPKK